LTLSKHNRDFLFATVGAFVGFVGWFWLGLSEWLSPLRWWGNLPGLFLVAGVIYLALKLSYSTFADNREPDGE
jgi:hypothetical protein